MDKCKNCVYNEQLKQMIKNKIYGMPNECIQCRKVKVLKIDNVNVIRCNFLDMGYNCKKFGKCKGNFCDYKRPIVNTEPRSELINRIALLSNQNSILNKKLTEYEKAGGAIEEGQAWANLANYYKGILIGIKKELEKIIQDKTKKYYVYEAIIQIIKEAINE